MVSINYSLSLYRTVCMYFFVETRWSLVELFWLPISVLEAEERVNHFTKIAEKYESKVIKQGNRHDGDEG